MTNKQDTKKPAYAEDLIKKQTAWWKTLLDVQAPYRWHLKRLNPGFMLDLGCGIGRNLKHINGNGVGIDHNDQAVNFVRQLGMHAYTPKEFVDSEFHIQEHYDTILLAHVAEHMTQSEVETLLGSYLSFLKPGGRVIIFTPQEAGFSSDMTHVEFMDFNKLRNINKQLNLEIQKEYSYPFPRLVGRFFLYNEFVTISIKK